MLDTWLNLFCRKIVDTLPLWIVLSVGELFHSSFTTDSFYLVWIRSTAIIGVLAYQACGDAIAAHKEVEA